MTLKNLPGIKATYSNSDCKQTTSAGVCFHKRFPLSSKKLSNLQTERGKQNCLFILYTTDIFMNSNDYCIILGNSLSLSFSQIMFKVVLKMIISAQKYIE